MPGTGLSDITVTTINVEAASTQDKKESAGNKSATKYETVIDRVTEGYKAFVGQDVEHLQAYFTEDCEMNPMFPVAGWNPVKGFGPMMEQFMAMSTDANPGVQDFKPVPYHIDVSADGKKAFVCEDITTKGTRFKGMAVHYYNDAGKCYKVEPYHDSAKLADPKESVTDFVGSYFTCFTHLAANYSAEADAAMKTKYWEEDTVMIRPSGNPLTWADFSKMMQSDMLTDITCELTSIDSVKSISNKTAIVTCTSRDKFKYGDTPNDDVVKWSFMLNKRSEDGAWRMAHGHRSTGQKPSE